MKPIVVSQELNVPISTVWNALTEVDSLHQWYFPIQDFVLEVGKTFTFYESETGTRFFHACTFLQIEPEKLIEHTWTHPNNSNGTSVLKWEIEAVENGTKVTLTHTGAENFSDAGPDFAVSNFEMGWNALVKTMLRNFVYGIQKLVFDCDIQATTSHVWEKLWSKENYSQWTEPFCEGTYLEGELKQGGRVHFLAPSGDGMYSQVAFWKENSVAIFSHIGTMKAFKEQPLDADTMRWTGCFESYKLNESETGTHLHVEVDTVPEYVSFMQEKFQLALNKLKEIAES